MSDPYELQRFEQAQKGCYQGALAELRGGRKVGHWMWFVFPQLKGLGRSPTSRRYAISGIKEARAYFDHPVLGARLIECVDAVTAHPDRTAADIFGGDAVKFHSSMTLFARAAPECKQFGRAVDQFFAGIPDASTDKLLSM